MTTGKLRATGVDRAKCRQRAPGYADTVDIKSPGQALALLSEDYPNF